MKTLLKFKGTMGEHGPHGLTLGPDGLLYVIVGNHSQADAEIDPEVFDAHLIDNLVTRAAKCVRDENLEIAIGFAASSVDIVGTAMSVS